MEPIKLECTFEERVSKKDSSKKYKAIFIKISDNYEKMVLVSIPEVALIESKAKNSDEINPYSSIKTLIIWFNPNKGVYYHRLVRGSYIEQDYSLGSKNSYEHVIVHKIEDFDFYKKQVPIKKRLINKSVRFLQKL